MILLSVREGLICRQVVVSKAIDCLPKKANNFSSHFFFQNCRFYRKLPGKLFFIPEKLQELFYN